MAKTKQELIEELKNTPDIDPYKHDGSYELVQKAVELYGRKENLDDVDYNDLNLIYFLPVGTWTYGIERKKELVKTSHLSEENKKVFLDCLDSVWQKANKNEYEIKFNGKPSIGMVGTGFKTFKNKCGNDDIKKFIQMCVDISKETSNEKATKSSSADYEKAFDITGHVLNNGIKGMGAATCSIILHCLRPYIFPILNSNNYLYRALDLNIKSTKLKDIKEYVNNCRVITEYMRDHDIFYNYRRIDLFSAQETPKHEINFDLIEDWLSENKDSEGETNKSENEDNSAFTEFDNFVKKVIDETRIYRNKVERTGENKEYPFIIKCINDGYAVVFTAELVGSEDDERLQIKINDLSNIYDKELENENTKKIVNTYSNKLKEILNNKNLISNKEVNQDKKTVVSKPQLPVNMILYGPPGTGKTYNSVIYAVGIIENKAKEEIEKYIKPNAMQKNAETQQNNENQTNDIKYSEILKKFNDYKVKHDMDSDNTDNGQIEFVTFHQSYGYEEFIEGIKPRTENGEIRYEIADGVFKKFCKKAENNPDKNYVFIIDEINRGNISKIFGELITLIEDTKRIGAAEEMRATLPYSGESFGVPDNVYILGTMNTADRSISLMDTALRRRFRFVEMMPNPTLIKANIVIDGKETDVDGKKLNVKEILETMNKRIEYLYDREHTIGHSFFMKLNETKPMDDLKNVMLNSVLPPLQEYFYDDYNKIRLVLGDNQKAGNEPCFVIKKNDNKNDLFGATDEINDTEVFEINEKAFGYADSYKYLLSGTGSPKHDQTGAETSSENK